MSKLYEKRFLSLIFLIGLFAIFTDINAQQETVKVNKAFVTESLSGNIVDINEGAIPFAKVSRCTPNWEKEIESVETGTDGKFIFNQSEKGIYYLRISAAGFNDLEIRVVLRKKSKNKLKLKLEIAN